MCCPCLSVRYIILLGMRVCLSVRYVILLGMTVHTNVLPLSENQIYNIIRNESSSERPVCNIIMGVHTNGKNQKVLVEVLV